jgi:hypothetical protein
MHFPRPSRRACTPTVPGVGIVPAAAPAPRAVSRDVADRAGAVDEPPPRTIARAVDGTHPGPGNPLHTVIFFI